MNSTSKASVVCELWRRNSVFRIVSGKKSVEGMLKSRAYWRKHWQSRLNRGLVGGFLKDESRLPRCPSQDPAAQKLQLGGRRPSPVLGGRGHHFVRVGTKKGFEENAFMGSRGIQNLSVFAPRQKGGTGIHGKSPLLFVAHVASAAVFL